MPAYRNYHSWITLKYDISVKAAYRQTGGNIDDYQLDELNGALAYCKSFNTAIDIGAHIGMISNQLSKRFKSVESFEIDTDVFECLKQNMQNKTSNVNIHNFGIGDSERDVDLRKTAKTFSTHVIHNSVGDYKIKSLDQLNFDNVDFIKIDAEGFEPLIANGALATIKKHKPIILYERKQHPKRYGYEQDSFLEILKPFGYTMLRKLGRGEKNAVIGVA
tara:strand:- start:103 stop:759 length:657 start_codon:yes stop_codon:yes gene_type:complete